MKKKDFTWEKRQRNNKNDINGLQSIKRGWRYPKQQRMCRMRRKIVFRYRPSPKGYPAFTVIAFCETPPAKGSSIRSLARSAADLVGLSSWSGLSSSLVRVWGSLQRPSSADPSRSPGYGIWNGPSSETTQSADSAAGIGTVLVIVVWVRSRWNWGAHI